MEGGPEVFPVGSVSGFNDSKEFSNSQKRVTLLTTILIHKRHWKPNDLALIYSLRVGYNLCNQSHSTAGINASASKSPGAPFSSSIFISTSGALSEDEKYSSGLWLPGCRSKSCKCFCSCARDKQSWGPFLLPTKNFNWSWMFKGWINQSVRADAGDLEANTK